MTTTTAGSRSAIMQALQAARRELLDAIEGFSPEQMTVPVMDDWSVKDMLAHVTSWEELTLPDLRRVKEGFIPALASFKVDEIDDWNAKLMSLRGAFPVEQVTQELAFYRRAFLEALEPLPDAAFAAGFVPSVCGIAAQHDREHAAQVREWRQREAI